METRTELDPEFEQRLRRGLALLAERTPPPHVRQPVRPSRPPVWAVAAATVIALATAAGGITFAVARNHNHHRAVAPVPVEPAPSSASTLPSASTPSSTVPPPLSAGLGVRYDLARLVADSDRIVVGTVVQVRKGAASDASGGLAFVIATVRVDQTLKGPSTGTVAAFDYDYSGTITSAGGVAGTAPTTSSEVSPGSPLGSSFAEGERVLLFLSSSAGTVHERIPPQHWQVTAGAQGEYTMQGDAPSAPFTLADIRRAVG